MNKECTDCGAKGETTAVSCDESLCIVCYSSAVKRDLSGANVAATELVKLTKQKIKLQWLVKNLIHLLLEDKLPDE